MDEQILLPLSLVKRMTYLGEVVLNPLVSDWLAPHDGKYRLRFLGALTRSSTNDHSFASTYNSVRPCVCFEDATIAEDFRKRWCA